jgi:hypothetical protein
VVPRRAVRTSRTPAEEFSCGHAAADGFVALDDLETVALLQKAL